MHTNMKIRCNHFQITVQAQVVSKCFIRGKPYPLSKQGFYGSPKSRRCPRGVPRDGHAMPRNNRQDIRRNFSPHIRATSGNGRAIGNANAADCPSRRHARQLALRRMRTRHVRAGKLARRLASNLNHDIQNYGHANYTNARSRIASQGGSRVPANSASRPVHQFETRP